MYKVQFINSDLIHPNFYSCEWNSSNRLIIFNESDYFKGISELNELENLYRQLKSNFQNSRDWELSGKAYVSELTIRKKRLYLEKKFFSWFLYSFYDKFGGFTQNYLRPFLWYVGFTFIFFPLLYFIIEITITDLGGYTILSNSYIKSFAASIPFINTDIIYQNWWVQSFQIVFSTILIAFFILALRKRFKQ